MYLPVMILANVVYDINVQESVINNIQTKWIQQTVNVLILLHCALAVPLVMNPISQMMEQWADAPAGKLDSLGN